MSPTTLRAHIAMVTSSSTTPISSICLSWDFQSARCSHSTVPGNNLQQTHSSPCLWFLHTYVRFGSVIGCYSLQDWDTKKIGEKRRNNELVKRQELWEAVTEKQATFPPQTKCKASVMAMVHCTSIWSISFDLKKNNKNKEIKESLFFRQQYWSQCYYNSALKKHKHKGKYKWNHPKMRMSHYFMTEACSWVKWLNFFLSRKLYYTTQSNFVLCSFFLSGSVSRVLFFVQLSY